MSRSQALFLAILNAAVFLGMVAVNALANALPLAGKNTGQLSDQYPNLFVPSGLTFSIWGLIYLLLAAFVAYGLVRSIRMPAPGALFLRSIGLLFAVSCAANAAWIFAWHYERLPLSLALMLVLLGTLAAIYLRLDVGRAAAGPAETYLVHLPMSIYLGWITVATIANATALLVASGWNRFGIGEQPWTILMMGMAAALALLVLFLRKDLFFALVVDWAILGILLKRTADPGASAPGLITASIVCLAVITLAMILQLARGVVYR